MKFKFVRLGEFFESLQLTEIMESYISADCYLSYGAFWVEIESQNFPLFLVVYFDVVFYNVTFVFAVHRDNCHFVDVCFYFQFLLEV